MEKFFTKRTKCIFCNNSLDKTYLSKDYDIPIACYSKSKVSYDIIIPYNIHKCKLCKTSQTKYLGDLNEVYKMNHADNTGSIMKDLHLTVLNLIKKQNRVINNIVEVGSSKGTLSDLILDEKIVNKYYIIEPTYIGTTRKNKIIINDYFENINFNEYKDANTLIISHVFEHFYEPNQILKVIQNNLNIKNFFLIWPDLEYYKDNNNYHVLNTEHTFYVDNNFIIDLLNNYTFELIEKIYYVNHSVIFYFKRNLSLKKKKLVNQNHDISNYFNSLISKKEIIQQFIKSNKKNGKQICIWPCSVHTQFLLVFINNLNIDYVLDNSPKKINKYLYGHNLKCLSFSKEINNKNNAVILNGGVFNKEIKKFVNLGQKSVLYI